MLATLPNIMLQSIELFSSENKKRIINALTVFQIIILYILASNFLAPWFPRALVVAAFFGLIYVALKKTDWDLS